MILPLDACPTAPAQGALAIECRAEDSQTRQLLSALHHAPTAAHIAREREVLKRYGGGCHQAFGATSLDISPNLPLTFVRGQSDAGEPLDHMEWNAPSYTAPIIPWNGLTQRHESQTLLVTSHQSPVASHFFLTHHRAATPELLPQLQGKHLWTSGVKSWRALAAKGLWVEGCAEGLGFAHIAPMLGDLSDWTILTHEAGLSEWEPGHAIAAYRVQPSPQEAEGMAEATHVYWGSGSQFGRLRHLAKSARHHACGAGKTAEILRAHGIEPDIFPSVKEWKKAITTP